MQTELYRHYDAGNRLLYVGVSLSTVARARQHRVAKAWAAKTARIEIERFPFRWLAIEAEKTAIITERPLFNVLHNSSRGGVEGHALRQRGKCTNQRAAEAGLVGIKPGPRETSPTTVKRGRPRIEERHLTLAATEPWKAAGMSRSSWYRRKAERGRAG